jgi:hypothetical protein
VSEILTEDESDDSYRRAIAATVEVFATKGLDLPRIANQWANDYLRELGERGSNVELGQLLRSGCKKLPLAASIKTGALLSSAPTVYREVMGRTEEIERMCRDLNKTANLFDGIVKSLSLDASSEWPMKTVLPSPNQMAEYLRMYTSVINLGPVLLNITKANSIRDIERHVLTAYVKRATGEWHDGKVSAIIAAATGQTLDEDTHRKWRNRNFSGINLPLNLISAIAEILAEQQDK